MPDKQLSDVRAVLNHGFVKLRFREPLEADFISNYQSHALRSFRTNVRYIFVIYLILGLGIVLLVPSDHLDVWPYSHGLLGLIILVAAICVHTEKLNRFYQVYTGLCATAGIVLTVNAPYFFRDPTVSQVAQMGVFYAVMVVYTMLGLRFVAATVSAWIAGALAVLSALLMDLPFNWLFFHETFTGASVLGMVLCYIAEHRSRTVFLQSRLLELEKSKSDSLALEMERMSREDPLTGLANRRYFDDVYQREWRRMQRDGVSLSIMFVDIDFFKNYNDFYGHQKGDECIRAVADIIASQAKRAGDLAARYGGEEFVVVYPQTSADAIESIAQRTLIEVRKGAIPHEQSQAADIVTVSIGIATVIPSKKLSPDDALKQADAALYRAKSQGRNQWSAAEDFQIPAYTTPTG